MADVDSGARRAKQHPSTDGSIASKAEVRSPRTRTRAVREGDRAASRAQAVVARQDCRNRPKPAAIQQRPTRSRNGAQRDHRSGSDQVQGAQLRLYGTLIDWETGIAAVLAAWAREQIFEPERRGTVLAYADNEAAVEGRSRGALSRRPRRGFRRLAAARIPVSDARAHGWPSRFPTGRRSPTPPRRWPAGAHYKLIIFSNVDRVLFAASNPRLRRLRHHHHRRGRRLLQARQSTLPRPRRHAPRPRRGSPWSAACRAEPVPRPRPGQAAGCRRSGSTAATTAPAGERPRNPPQSGPSTWSSTPWPTSQTLSTNPSPTPDYRLQFIGYCMFGPLGFRLARLGHLGCLAQSLVGR